MKVDSDEVTLSPDEFTSGTLTWQENEQGTWRVGVASEDDSDWQNGEVIEAVVAIATLTGQGAVDLTGRLGHGISTNLQSDSLVESRMSGRFGTSGTLEGSGILTVPLSILKYGSIVQSSDSSLTADSLRGASVSTTFESTSFLAFEAADKQFGTVTFKGESIKQADGHVYVLPSASLEGGGILDTNVNARLIFGSQLTGAGETDIWPVRKTFSSFELSGDSLLQSDSHALKWSSTSFSGDSDMDPLLSILKYPEIELSGEGLIEGHHSIRKFPAIDFSGTGNVIADKSMVHRTVVDFSATGIFETEPVLRRNRLKHRYRATAIFQPEIDVEAIAGEHDFDSIVIDRSLKLHENE